MVAGEVCVSPQAIMYSWINQALEWLDQSSAGKSCLKDRLWLQAHLVVVNLQIESATVFRAILSGNAFNGSFLNNVTAARMFVRGATLTISKEGAISDWIGPGATNVCKCTSHPSWINQAPEWGCERLVVGYRPYWQLHASATACDQSCNPADIIRRAW